MGVIKTTTIWPWGRQSSMIEVFFLRERRLQNLHTSSDVHRQEHCSKEKFLSMIYSRKCKQRFKTGISLFFGIFPQCFNTIEKSKKQNLPTQQITGIHGTCTFGNGIKRYKTDLALKKKRNRYPILWSALCNAPKRVKYRSLPISWVGSIHIFLQFKKIYLSNFTPVLRVLRPKNYNKDFRLIYVFSEKFQKQASGGTKGCAVLKKTDGSGSNLESSKTKGNPVWNFRKSPIVNVQAEDCLQTGLAA